MSIKSTLIKGIPAALVISGIIGMGGTAYLAVRKTNDISGKELGTKDKIKAYAPIAGLGLISAAAIGLGFGMKAKQVKSLISSVNSLSEVSNTGLGAIGGAMLEREKQVLTKDDEKLWFYDEFSDTFFKSTWKDILMAETNAKDIMASKNKIELNSYYSLIGFALGAYDYPDELGWDLKQIYDYFSDDPDDFEIFPIEYFDGFGGHEKAEAITIHFPILPKILYE